MTLASDFFITGIITGADDNPEPSATITAYNITDRDIPMTATTTTVTDGSYSVNVKTICTDGDEIFILAESTTGYKNGKSFSLVLLDITKVMDIIIDEYTTLNLTSANYESKLRYCPLNSPDNSITKNIDVVNFWTDKVAAVDKDINSQPMNLSGIEYATTASDVPYLAYKFEQIWNIMEDDEEITIDCIDTCYNGVYVIKNFTFDSILRCANAYNWYLSLEKVRDV
jgi:hypothetical protein